MSIGLESRKFKTVFNAEYYDPLRKREMATRTIRYKVEQSYLVNMCEKCEIEWCPVKDLLRNKARQKQSRIKAILEESENGGLLVTMRFASKSITEHRELMEMAICVELVDSYED